MSSIRPMQQPDVPFVRSAWSSSYRTSYHAGMIHMSDYADIMHKQIDHILTHPTTSVLVAEEPGEVDHEGRSFIYAFLAYHRDLSHFAICDQRTGHTTHHPYVYYVYVKSPYRSPPDAPHPMRHATRLFSAAGINPAKVFAYACRTPYCSELASKIPLAQYNPLPARYL